MRIREAEMLAGISKKNIRFYEDAGLLKPGRSEENSYREYSPEDVRRLKVIKLLRKLDMPVSEIRDIFEGKLSLPDAAARHGVALGGQIRNLAKAKSVVEHLAAEACGLNALDEEAWLRRLEEMEGEGISFMNIQNQDTRKKYTVAAVACACVIAVFAALIVLLAWAQGVDPMPLGLFIAFIAIFAGCIICTAAAFFRDIKK